MRHFSGLPRESPPLGLKSKCSIAEARRSRASAESTAMRVQEVGVSRQLSEIRLRKLILFFSLEKKNVFIFSSTAGRPFS